MAEAVRAAAQGMEEPPASVDPATEVLAEMTEMKAGIGEIKTAVTEVNQGCSRRA